MPGVGVKLKRCNAWHCAMRRDVFLVQDTNNVLLEPRVCVESVLSNVAVT